MLKHLISRRRVRPPRSGFTRDDARTGAPARPRPAPLPPMRWYS